MSTPVQGRIRLLDPALASQIAAGEVVERPASVVKELLENSIDAGATYITLEIEEGGISLIRVSDDGRGFLREDLPLAFERHATSKLTDVSELTNLAWMGFRGEALYSIAAVSRVTLVTKRREDEAGSKVICEGGVLEPVIDTGCPDGTTISVENLFFNVPARKKFLKSAHSEAAAVSSCVSRIILSHPGVAFRFISDGKTVYQSSGDGVLKNAVYTVFGKEIIKGIFEIDDEFNGIRLHGCLGLPAAARSNRQQELFFVNRRSIRSAILTKAVENGYGTTLMKQRFPFCVLFLELPGPMVDVNVHPNKLEVRFSDESLIFKAVNTMVNGAIRRSVQRPLDFSLSRNPSDAEPSENIRESMFRPYTRPQSVSLSSSGQPADFVVSSPEPREEKVPVTVAESAKPDPVKPEEASPQTEQLSMHDAVQRYREEAFAAAGDVRRSYTDVLSQNRTEPEALRQVRDDIPLALPREEELPQDDYKVIGTAFSTYILLESGDRMIWIDQHAAHERILFDRYMKELSEHAIVSQELLIPQLIEVSYEEKQAILENMDFLTASGFELSEYGRLSFSIRALPQVLGQIRAQELIGEILTLLEKHSMPEADERNMAIAQAACKHAVKAGDPLDEREIRELYKIILREKVPLTCPHGRPICMVMTRRELEKQFRRVVS